MSICTPSLMEPQAQRMKQAAAVGVLVCLASCVPELEPAVPPCDAQRTPYDLEPEKYKTPELEDAIVQYQALAGRWVADFACPPASAAVKTLTFAIETRPRSEIVFWSGCGAGTSAVTTCRAGLSGPDFAGLDGQSTELAVAFLPNGIHKLVGGGDLDASYDTSLDSVRLSVGVDMENAVVGWLTYALQPHINSDGSGSQAFYECSWANARRVP
jgi:hypothetical protein